MDHRSTGLLIVIIGVVVIVVGALVTTGALSWFGRLPGDIRYQGQNVRVYIPITSMIILSVVLTLVLALFRR
jgi:hypothetical protein